MDLTMNLEEYTKTLSTKKLDEIKSRVMKMSNSDQGKDSIFEPTPTTDVYMCCCHRCDCCTCLYCADECCNEI